MSHFLPSICHLVFKRPELERPDISPCKHAGYQACIQQSRLAMISHKYVQACDRDLRMLGQGGCSAGVERCFSAATGQAFAVKRLSPLLLERYPYLELNETGGLFLANGLGVPRVVKFVDQFYLPSCEVLLVLELVEGTSLSGFIDRLFLAGSIEATEHESVVLAIAAELLQTVGCLHQLSSVAHLDITSNNIMLRNQKYAAWDQVRLIDFGNSQQCSPDAKVRDVIPHGATVPYAAPELLWSLQLQFEGADPDTPYFRINGPSADFWAVGVVLYELLTGELPFTGEGYIAAQVPESVPPHLKPDWESQDCMVQDHLTWIEADNQAYRTQTDIQHPLLDRVRQCSANPDQAVAFFWHIFSLTPHSRVTALDHSWCAAATSKMLAEMPPMRFAPPHTGGHRASKSWWRAALSKCCCGASSTVESNDTAVPAATGMLSDAVKGSTSSCCVALDRSQADSKQAALQPSRIKDFLYIIAKPFDRNRARREREYYDNLCGPACTDCMAARERALQQANDISQQSAAPPDAACTLKLQSEAIHMTAASGTNQGADRQEAQQEQPVASQTDSARQPLHTDAAEVVCSECAATHGQGQQQHAPETPECVQQPVLNSSGNIRPATKPSGVKRWLSKGKKLVQRLRRR